MLYVATTSSFSPAVGVCAETPVRGTSVASANPAKLLGIYDKKGSLAPGKDADICVLDNRLQVTHTIVDGNLVYEAGVTEDVRPVSGGKPH